MPDSSIIQIGDRTDVELGKFRADPNDPNVETLDHGALRFEIRHPQGPQSSYVFRTSTTQIAVRGTIAYLVVGAAGEQVYCIECSPGDVSVRVFGLGSYTVESGQTLSVRNVGAKAFDAAIVPNATINNPAIDQFLNGYSPFGQPAANGSDATGSESGT